jgi:WD40 repeat protein
MTSFVDEVLWSSDSQRIASSYAVFDVETGKLISRLDADYRVRFRVWHPNNRWLTATADGEIWIWDIQENRLVSKIPTTYGYYGMRDLAWSPDRSTLALGGSDGVIRLWDVSDS